MIVMEFEISIDLRVCGTRTPPLERPQRKKWWYSALRTGVY